jgi:hypothetical protein
MSIQQSLFPHLEEILDPLTEKEREFVRIVELMEVDKHLRQYGWVGIGRKPKDRKALVLAFTAKAVWNLPTTLALIEYLEASKNLRRLCGWERVREIPSESTFSRAFHAFSQGQISAVLTSASLHDSQAAIPLAQMSQERVTNLYDLMDSAYDAPQIKEFSRQLGHAAIIDQNPRRGEKVLMDPAQAERFKERSTSERTNSQLKDNYGGRFVRVRGAEKVMAHLMFGLIALTATQLYRLIE